MDKAELKHLVEHNDLVDALAESRDFFRKYGLGLAVLVGMVLASATVWSLVQTRNQEQLKESWTDYLDAVIVTKPDPERLMRIAAVSAGTPASTESLIFAGNTLLEEGVNQLFKDRKTALAKLENAAASFSRAIDSSDREFYAQWHRALLGLARSQESMGKLEDAKRSYQTLAKEGLEPYSTIAARRKTMLDDPAGQKFYDWLAKYEAPPAPESPLGTTPGLPGLDGLNTGPLSLPPAGQLPSPLPPASDTPTGSDPVPSGGLVPDLFAPEAGTLPPVDPAATQAPAGGQASSSSEAPVTTTDAPIGESSSGSALSEFLSPPADPAAGTPASGPSNPAGPPQ